MFNWIKDQLLRRPQSRCIREAKIEALRWCIGLIPNAPGSDWQNAIEAEIARLEKERDA